MSRLRIGFLGIAHMHWHSYAAALAAREDAEIVGAYDPVPARLERFSHGPTFSDPMDLIARSDAVIVTSENVSHPDLAIPVLEAGKPVLCEKPLAIDLAAGERMLKVAAQSGTLLMTAFPCPYSPIFERLEAQVHGGAVGRVRAICATNRGKCPFDWFVVPELSGGGAMIDHTVHVADLVRRLLGEEPTRVEAVVGHRMHGQAWDDSALLLLDHPGGVFATIDASWSRPASFSTWGDVTLSVVGDAGTIEADLFAQTLDVYTDAYRTPFFGSDLDERLVDDFLGCIRSGATPRSTGEDGLAAARVALAGYSSLSAPAA